MSFLDTLNKLLGDPNKKELKKLRPIAARVEEMRDAPEITKLTLEDLPKKTEELKAKLAGGMKIDDILPEAFAVVIQACRVLVGKTTEIGKQTFAWDMVPFPVQVIGGIALHRGCIAEMKTGEGKTLVCTMPVYLNALAGKGVHVVTVNDYLARRDAAWMGLLYGALGLTVGVVVPGLNNEQRKQAYAADVAYGTNSEFGFDYLRDNMATSLARRVQRGLHYAIVDEVDSILIDEARTPLIISQPAQESTVKYQQHAKLVGQLVETTHFVRDEKQRTATLTEEGIKKMEELLGLENIYTERGFQEVHHIEQALRAHAIYKRDVDYVVREGQIIIVDEFTGRMLPGRRYSHGLHQAIEAKENVEVQRESRTLATITFQNYFRLYSKLAGMTGTAKTEEEEFESIYKVRTVVIPTHRQTIRNDAADAVYRSVPAKFKAVAVLAKEKYDKGQPVLIGTTSIEKSEAMSLLLQEMQVPHQVLNAKHHEKEAEIVAKAGQKGAITIATNMAGRGTDIKLGEGAREVGGLAILGTERHEARRIDNQLRGRSGRQGDPGESRFFVSMEDDLMRLFGGDRLKSMMERLNVPEDVPLENSMVSRAIESAQKKVEGRNFDIRRHVLQYDDVMNRHREIIYRKREKILHKLEEGAADGAGDSAETLHADVLAMIVGEATSIVESHTPGDDPDEWNIPLLCENIAAIHAELAGELRPTILTSFEDRGKMITFVTEQLTRFYEQKCAAQEKSLVARAEGIVLLRSIDTHWMDHIDDMSHLREQVAFAGFAQRDPLIEYQDQGFRRFQQLMLTISGTTIRTLFQIDFRQFALQVAAVEQAEDLEGLETNEAEIEGELEQTGVIPNVYGAADTQDDPLRVSPKRQRSGRPVSKNAMQNVGRNDPCPCGSGKKFKKCHGKNA